MNVKAGLRLDVCDDATKTLFEFAQKTRIHSWTTVQDLKEKINNERNYPIADQRLYLNNQELQSSQMISDALKGSAVSTPYGRHEIVMRLKTPQSTESQAASGAIDIFGTLARNQDIEACLHEIR